ncbi:Alpha/Beta hydrolase protein [Syncephalis fuscata]|nr:Alpha/Beta hydrolase protein [Syncephalis fuscata]
MTVTKLTTIHALTDPAIDVNTAESQPLTAEKLASLPRINNPSVSPDGRQCVYSQYQYNVAENRYSNNLWLIDINESSVQSDDSITPPVSNCSAKPRLLTDAIPGSTKQLTRWPNNISTVRYHQEAGLLAFTANICEGKNLNDTTQNNINRFASKVGFGITYDSLYVRQWDRFVNSKKSHLFTVRVKQSFIYGYQLENEPINLMASSSNLECSPYPFGSIQDYVFSADGKEIAFVAKLSGRERAWHTKSDIYIVPTDGSAQPRSLTDSNLGVCSEPAYSPDGKYLAWLQTARHGYESDCNQIAIMKRPDKKLMSDVDNTVNNSSPLILATQWDCNPKELVWLSDSLHFIVTAEYLGCRCIFRVDATSGQIQQLTQHGYSEGIIVINSDQLLFSHSTANQPSELFLLDLRDLNSLDADKHVVYRAITPDANSPSHSGQYPRTEQLTKASEQLMQNVTLSRLESFWFTGANEDKIHGWLVRPFEFKPEKKYPTVLLIHGGPQGAWFDNFHYRWNVNLFTANGFAVVAINPHGSVGYGQKFTDSIENRWGSWPYEDLMMGLDYVLEQYSFLDGDRLCALGASYGGYMTNWINGQTRRFRCLVSQAGIFNIAMSYYVTDELFFPEHEFAGLPWKNPTNFTQWSPDNHVAKWETPVLIIHGEKDYRVDISHSIAAFTALQRRNITSRFLYFPDEGHWITKPLNFLRWYNEIIDWIKYHTMKTKLDSSLPNQ